MPEGPGNFDPLNAITRPNLPTIYPQKVIIPGVGEVTEYKPGIFIKASTGEVFDNPATVWRVPLKVVPAPKLDIVNIDPVAVEEGIAAQEGMQVAVNPQLIDTAEGTTSVAWPIAAFESEG